MVGYLNGIAKGDWSKSMSILRHWLVGEPEIVSVAHSWCESYYPCLYMERGELNADAARRTDEKH